MFKKITFQTPFNHDGDLSDAIAVTDTETGVTWYNVTGSTYVNATFDDVVNLGATHVSDIDCFSVSELPVTFDDIIQHIEELAQEGY